MIKKLLFLAICIIAPCIKALGDEYTVSKVYEVEELPYGSKAIDTYVSVVEIDKLFVPVKLEEGKYKVTVSRKGDDLCRIDGTDYYIETSLC